MAESAATRWQDRLLDEVATQLAYPPTPTPRTPPTSTPTAAFARTPSPAPTAAAESAPPPRPAVPNDVADSLTLAAATAALGFDPALPSGYGEPTATYLLRRLPDVVVLQYEDFDLWQRRNSSIFVGKGVPENLLIDTPLERGNPSYWIEGGRHFMRFLDEDGEAIAGTERAVDRNTLIWRSGETFYRLETDLLQAEAIAIAESLP